MHRPRDRARVPPREPNPVRHGLLRHQLLQAPHLGVRGVQEDDLPRRRYPSVRQHRSPVRSPRRVLLRGDGLLLREDVEPHPAIQDRVLPTVPRQGEVARARARPTPLTLLQRGDVRLRAEPRHREISPRNPRNHPSDTLRRARFSQHVLQGYLQADPARVQFGARHAVEAPGECGAGEGEGRPLLRCGIKAVEVHGEGGEHGQGGHKDAGEEVVGHIRRRVAGLQRPRRGGSGCNFRGRRSRSAGARWAQEAVPRRAFGGWKGPVRHSPLCGVTARVRRRALCRGSAQEEALSVISCFKRGRGAFPFALFCFTNLVRNNNVIMMILPEFRMLCEYSVSTNSCLCNLEIAEISNDSLSGYVLI